jgi:hypothetical protein
MTTVTVVWRTLPNGDEHRQPFQGPNRYAAADAFAYELGQFSNTYHIHTIEA